MGNLNPNSNSNLKPKNEKANQGKNSRKKFLTDIYIFNTVDDIARRLDELETSLSSISDDHDPTASSSTPTTTTTSPGK